MRTCFGCIVLACVLCVAAAATAETEYAAIFMNDVKIGHTVDTREVAGGEVTHRQKMQITLDRGLVAISIAAETEFVETPDGRPLRFRYTSQLGPLGASTKRGEIRDGQIHLTTDQMGTSYTSVTPYPEGALMPEGQKLAYRANVGKPGTTFSIVEFYPDSLQGIAAEICVGAPTSMAVIGQVMTLIPLKIDATVSGQTLTMRAWVDEDLKLKKMEMKMLGIPLRIVACDKAYATGPNGRLNAMDAASVVAPTPIAAPRRATEATYTLVPVGKDIKLDLPATGAQKVKVASDGSVTVTVVTPSPAKGSRPYLGADPVAQAALLANAYIESDHPAIKAQAKKIVGGGSDAMAAAKLIEKWVGRHISDKNMTIGYASALAVLKGKAGDCSEHAVLTAALCRAAGVPCRVVVGVAYVDSFGGLTNRFMGHAWDEAYVGGVWVGLDASLGAADAARVALSVGGGDPISFIGMINSLGNFKMTRAQVK